MKQYTLYPLPGLFICGRQVIVVSGTEPSRASELPIRDKIGNKSCHEVKVLDMSLTFFSRSTLLSEFSERNLVENLQLGFR